MLPAGSRPKPLSPMAVSSSLLGDALSLPRVGQRAPELREFRGLTFVDFRPGTRCGRIVGYSEVGPKRAWRRSMAISPKRTSGPPHDSLLQHARYACRCLQFDSEIGSAKSHSERPGAGQESEGRLEYFSQKKRGECDFLDASANHSMKGKYTEERRQEGNQDR